MTDISRLEVRLSNCTRPDRPPANKRHLHITYDSVGSHRLACNVHKRSDTVTANNLACRAVFFDRFRAIILAREQIIFLAIL